jgi:hypothetical protein
VAGAQVPPLRVSEVPSLMLRDLAAFGKLPNMAGIDLGGLEAKLTAFQTAAKAVDAKAAAAERAGDAAAMDALYAKAEVARASFYMPDGLTYNKYWHTIDRYVAPFPEVNYASYETDGRAEKVKVALDRLGAAADHATAALTQ